MGLKIIDIILPEILQEAKDMYKGLIDKMTRAINFFMIINKPYSGFFFKLVKEYLSEKNYTEILQHLCIQLEYPNADKNVYKNE